ncbi:MAG: ribosome silencing factor [Proteobacteria bacterium]|nr:ribosome silencing factor [Pseudomonadota bacterium]
MTKTTRTQENIKAKKKVGSPVTKGASRRTVDDVSSIVHQGSSEGLESSLSALALALDKKAVDPVLLDVQSLCSFCNYQLVLSGRSERQVDAIADGIAAGLKADGIRPIASEGARTGQWALLDYGDFVVHVFLESAREHYDLEGLWNDAPRVKIEVPAEARSSLADQYESA